MIASFHSIAFLASEYLKPEWQKDVRDITQEMVDCLHEIRF